MFKEAESHRVGGQFENFSKVIHKLKNNLLLLGMDHIKADLRFVEEFSRKGEKIVKVEKLFEKIKQAWQDAIPEVEEALSYYGEG
jgi:aryl carrier-like protein